MLISKLAFDLC